MSGLLMRVVIDLVLTTCNQQQDSQANHTTILFSLYDYYILSREWRVIVDQVQTNYHGRSMVPNQSGVTKLLIIKDPHYGWMCFKSVKTLGALHS